MKKNCFLLHALIFFFLIGVPHSSYGASISDMKGQIGVQITIYNNNLGLIKDTRKVSLPLGQGELRFMDVASHIMPVTVHAKSLNYAEAFTVLEQNYEYDLMNANKLLDKYVGKKIKLIDFNKFQDRKEVVEAILLSNNQGQIYKINDEIYLGHPGFKILPKIPENLIAKPTLTWLFQNDSKNAHQLEVSYLTNNINWRADYVLLLHQDDMLSDLTGWVTLDNRSGATYKEARLKLVAGEVHRVEDRFDRKVYAMKETARAAAPQFKEKSFFEYHIYDLERKTTIKNKQTKQISLLEANQVKVQKELLVYGITSYFKRKYQEKIPRQPVNVYIKFINAKENNLGMPLPEGIIRLYKEDDDESLQFIGEDRIEHTPKDEEITLKIGEAFDVVAERTQTDYKRISTRLYESEWEIILKNHKQKQVTVGVVEPLFGNWTIVCNSHPYKKIGAFTIRFDVTIPQDGEQKIRYRVRVGL